MYHRWLGLMVVMIVGCPTTNGRANIDYRRGGQYHLEETPYADKFAYNQYFHAHDSPSECDQSWQSASDGSAGGVITSPGYPGSYNVDKKCTYSFESKETERVQIIFSEFVLFRPEDGTQLDVADGKQRCRGEHDHMTAYVMIGHRLSEIDTFCGNDTPPQLMSSETFLTLDFIFKSSMLHRPKHLLYRYKFTYKFVTNYGIKGLSIDPEHPCGFEFNSSHATSGILYSPNYPGYYPRNTDCHYEFHGAPGEKVRIHFTYFDVEGYKHCHNDTQSDYIIFSNYQTEDRTNKRFCGQETPMKYQPIESEANYFRMVFHANAIFDATGFYASYQFSQPARAAIISVKTSGAVATTATAGHWLMPYASIATTGYYYYKYSYSSRLAL